MSNVEQGIPNDEVKSILVFPSAFVIRYSIFYGSSLRSSEAGEAGRTTILNQSRPAFLIHLGFLVVARRFLAAFP
jgi:hypothetical protein